MIVLMPISAACSEHRERLMDDIRIVREALAQFDNSESLPDGMLNVMRFDLPGKYVRKIQKALRAYLSRIEKEGKE